jgi:hypothetical protein
MNHSIIKVLNNEIFKKKNSILDMLNIEIVQIVIQ